MNKKKLIDLYQNSKLFSMIDSVVTKRFRKRLTNEDFSILCPNCIGGIIYHRLGKKFLSPTINLWMTQPDFLTFLLHISDYLKEPLCFIGSENNTPVATLGNNQIPSITIHFNHASSEEQAELEWNRRKNRINFDNLYIIMYYHDLTEKEVHLLDNYPCNNKVIFTKKPVEGIAWSYYIEPNYKSQNPSAYLGKDIFGVRWFEKKFDYVSFLNAKPNR